MSVPTTAWSETSPAGSDALNAGDNRIREMKTQIREVIDVDHQFNSSGSDADNGKHNKVSLLETSDIGTGASGKPILGAQTVSSKPELVYTDEDNNDVQITSAGKLHAPSLAGVYPAANVAALATIMGFVYPVGSYYFNESDSTNPGTLLGVGTWVAVEERFLVGYKSGDSDFGTAGTTGGERTHTLTVSEVPSLTATVSRGNLDTAGSGLAAGNAPNTGSATITTNGSGGAHNTLPPFRVVYIWRRTA